MGSKSNVQFVADYILRLSANIYRRIVSFVLSKRTRKALEMTSVIVLEEKPDLIHALRTQPEGIIANALFERYTAPLVLTTWGQDFILWSKFNKWIRKKTIETISNTSLVFPDNYRDNRIIKEDYTRIENICLKQL